MVSSGAAEVHGWQAARQAWRRGGKRANHGGSSERGRRCKRTPAANKLRMMHGRRWERLRHVAVGVAGLHKLHRRISGGKWPGARGRGSGPRAGGHFKLLATFEFPPGPITLTASDNVVAVGLPKPCRPPSYNSSRVGPGSLSSCARRKPGSHSKLTNFAISAPTNYRAGRGEIGSR